MTFLCFCVAAAHNRTIPSIPLELLLLLLLLEDGATLLPSLLMRNRSAPTWTSSLTLENTSARVPASVERTSTVT